MPTSRLYTLQRIFGNLAFTAAIDKTAQQEDILQLDLPEALLRIQCYETIDSTSQALQRRFAAGEDIHASCIQARQQTAGYGRLNRSWMSQPGSSLLFSLAWQFKRELSAMSALPLATGVILAQALEQEGLKGISLKWPNDLVYSFQKLAGILVEVVESTLTHTTIIIGIGLNICLPETLKTHIGQAATDLTAVAKACALPAPIDHNRLFACLLRALAAGFSRYEKQGFAAFSKDWEALHCYQGKPVKLAQPSGTPITGIVKGIRHDGAILIQHDEMNTIAYMVGDISLRKLKQGV